jgi:hypothetical protein
MKFSWMAVLNTKDKVKIPLLMRKIEKQMGATTTLTRSEQMYCDKNWKIFFDVPVKATTWAEAVVEGIRNGYQLAYNWGLSGDGETGIEAHNQDSFKMSGLLWLSWSLNRNDNASN